MALGTFAGAQFCGGGGAAGFFPVDIETAGDPAAGYARTKLAAGILCAPALLLRRADADGQRIHAQRMAASRAAGGNVQRDVAYRQDILQERSQARTSTRNRKSSRTSRANRSDGSN